MTFVHVAQFQKQAKKIQTTNHPVSPSLDKVREEEEEREKGRKGREKQA
jgi:hypothetical protein